MRVLGGLQTMLIDAALMSVSNILVFSLGTGLSILPALMLCRLDRLQVICRQLVATLRHHHQRGRL
jgi:hypothetical protein